MKLFKALFGRKDGHQYSFYAPKGPVGDDDVEGVTQVATKKRKDGLTLANAALSERGLGKVLETMPDLKALKLESAALTDETVALLKGFESLEFLDLTGVPVNGSCFAHFETLPNLWYLNVSQTQFLDMAVLGLSRFPNLHTLDLSGSRVTQRGLPYCSRLDSLRVLRAGELGLDDSILSAFAEQEELKVEL